ncbi:hypothetical protein TNCV_823691 [Trichonephila clavipes]|nr:hypothetical protein TNCV_823691 [Trichonephila clavipes]
MENQRLGVAGGVILCYVKHGRIQYYRRGTPVNQFSFISHLETHKNPVGTALHIHEANRRHNTDKQKKQLQHKAAGYMTTEKRAKRQRERERESSFQRDSNFKKKTAIIISIGGNSENNVNFSKILVQTL